MVVFLYMSEIPLNIHPNSPVDLLSKAEKVLSYLDKEGDEIIVIGDTNL